MRPTSSWCGWNGSCGRTGPISSAHAPTRCGASWWTTPATAEPRSAEHVSLENALEAAQTRPAELVALDEALERLREVDERQVRIVECRFFAGMSVEDTAEALGISPATVKRDWTTARAWLNRELSA